MKDVTLIRLHDLTDKAIYDIDKEIEKAKDKLKELEAEKEKLCETSDEVLEEINKRRLDGTWIGDPKGEERFGLN